MYKTKGDENPVHKRCKLDQYAYLETLLKSEKENIYLPPMTRSQTVSRTGGLTELEKNHATMKRIYTNLAKVEKHYKLTRDQRIFIGKLIESMLKVVFLKTFSANELSIRKMYRLVKKEFKKATAVTAPRRFGKSHVIVIACAVFFMSVENMDILIVAQSVEAVSKHAGLGKKIREFLKVAFGMERFHSDSAKHMAYEFAPNDVRRIHFYTDNMNDAIRGQGTKLLILEETACLDPEVIKLVLLPLLSRSFCVPFLLSPLLM